MGGLHRLLVVGCLILSRRPSNVIGWIFTAVGLLTMTAGLAAGYAKYAYVTHPCSQSQIGRCH